VNEAAAPELFLRDARDDDGPGLLSLIGGVFDEYPGCVTDADEMPELRAIASYVRKGDGRFWVYEDSSTPAAPRVVACVGFTVVSGGVELKKLYVDRSARRRGLGGKLCTLVEDAARARAAGFVELWSDTRFRDAHRLYLGRGYAQTGVTRELHDKSDTVEYYFRLALAST
jgi:putative acetyltransferase